MRPRAQFQSAAVTVWPRVLFARVPNCYLLSHWQARQYCPAVAKIQHLAHFVEKLRMRVVALPAPRIPQFDEILLPGEKGFKTEEKRRRDGIPMPDRDWEEFQKLAQQLNVSMDKIMAPAGA